LNNAESAKEMVAKIDVNAVVTKNVPKNAVFCATEGHIVKFRV